MVGVDFLKSKNILYAQSGGVTSVINASAYGLISKALKSEEINKIYAGIYGISGILEGNLLDIKKNQLKRSCVKLHTFKCFWFM